MTDRHDLRPDQDLDTSSYASLPETKAGGFVSKNSPPIQVKVASLDWKGCHPSRWIYELLNNNFTLCDIFDRARKADFSPSTAWQHTHRLIINGNQSGNLKSARLLSSVCLDCHFHFVFKMRWDDKHIEELCNNRHSQWPLKDGRSPWHHLVWTYSVSEAAITADRSKYYPTVACETFRCSSDPCSFEVTLEISEPRMPPWWIDLLLDKSAILDSLRVAKEQDPDRYAAATEEWATQAPLNLNTYLKNLLEATSKENARSISKRNKRFFVLFGPRCFKMFRELEFEETISMGEDGVDGGSFTPPVPLDSDVISGITELGTYRAFIEDVRAEIQCIIHRRGEPADLCTPSLHADLGCSEVSNPNEVFVKLERYKLMGVLPNQPKEIVVNAYHRQWELLPTKKRQQLLEALRDIANDLNDEQLTEYAMIQSSIYESQVPVQTNTNPDDNELINQALLFFGLQPPNHHSAESIVTAFRQKVTQDPSCATTARNMLMLIAQSAVEETYRAQLMMEYAEGFSLPAAKEILGLADANGFGSEALDHVKEKIRNAKDKDAKATFLDAMERIAEHTHSIDLKNAVAELRQQNDIMASFPTSGSSIQAADFDLPVGLENIGNTCYLNSLLQYLFTVKPVRDIAVNYDDFKLELADEHIKERLLGGNKMQLDRGEAVVAQAFAQELSELFSNLETSDKMATRPSQRLANAVLLSTRTLLDDTKSSEETATGSKPPPLPNRPPPDLPENGTEDVEMVTIVPGDGRDPIDTASTVSSQTLVEEDSDRSYEKVETLPATAEGQVIDSVMEVEQDEDVVEIRPNHEMTKNTETAGKINNTIADETQAIDTKMKDAEEPQTVDQKVLTALEHQKRSSGTDQQDVEEVMGSILNRLQAAIRPSSIDDSTGIQLEKIMETFFVTTINYTKKFDDTVYQKEISFDRSITAFPAQEGTCSLYDALGRNFDQQIIEESKLSRYTAIKTLPPVLHVLIQRTQSTGNKNGNPVEIPEMLHLDRYMDAPHDSSTFQDRVKGWANASRISDIKAHKSAVESTAPTGPLIERFEQEEQANDIITAVKGDSAMEDGADGSEESWNFDGTVDDDFLLINRPVSTLASTINLPPKPQNVNDTETAIRERMKTELLEKEGVLEKYYSDLQSNPYRLHAVICHRGQLMSGHYWVWIYDFEQNVWRKYNDSSVEVNRSTAEVLAILSTSGEPYFLCYVRDEDKEKYVDVPRRRRLPPSSSAQVQSIDADGDIRVANNEPGEITESTHGQKSE